MLPSEVFSTRAAFVFQPKEGHSLRLSYNRAFSTPTALNAFLDVSGGVAPPPLGPLGYTGRAFGSGLNGWSLQESPGTVRGMRSPFNPTAAGGAAELLDADVSTMWQMAINALLALGEIDAPTAGLLGTLPPPTNSDIARLLQDVNTGDFVPLAGAVLPDLPAIDEAYTETFELGWTGLIADNRLSITADVYYTRKNDFVSPLVVETPLLYLDGADLVTYLTPILTGVLGPVLGPAQADTLGAGVAMIPLGVVSSDEVGAQGADLIQSYRNVGDFDLWGADFAFQASLTNQWTLGGSYSHMSDDYIEITGGAPIALNAPKDKGSLSLTFRDVLSGFNASGRVRFTSSFPAQSAVGQGTACITGGTGGVFEQNCVDSYANLRHQRRVRGAQHGRDGATLHQQRVRHGLPVVPRRAENRPLRDGPCEVRALLGRSGGLIRKSCGPGDPPPPGSTRSLSKRNRGLAWRVMERSLFLERSCERSLGQEQGHPPVPVLPDP